MKSVIVTGASSGIGRISSLLLAHAGFQVFGLSRNLARLEELASEMPPGKYYPIEFDVTKHDAFSGVVSEIALRGQIFALVNNAGYVEPGTVEDLSMDNLRSQFETNFFGLVGLTKQVLPHLLRSRDGRIVNVSSMAGLVTLPLIGAYCATKHVLEAITDALRMELWGSGIKVVTINPGVIDTNIHSVTTRKLEAFHGSRFARAYEKYLADVPQGLPADAVGQAILDAVNSKKPKQRYLIGSAKEKTGVRLRPLIPDSVFYSQVARRILS